MRGLGPSWDKEVIAKAYNLTLVHKTMYAGILRQLSPVDILALFYVLGRDSFERGPSHLIGRQLLDMTLNQAYALLCMLTGETKRILAVARGVQAYITKDSETKINKRQPTKLFDLHFKSLHEWIMEEDYSRSGIDIDPQKGSDYKGTPFPSQMAL